MRQFTKDAPDLFIFQIEGSEKTYKIPLAASMPVKTLMKMQYGLEGQVEILEKYMGSDIDELTVTEVTAILKAWSDASTNQGASVGES